MIQTVLRKLAGAFCLALLLLALAGCGRRGPPEAPEAATPDQTQAPTSSTSSNYGAPVGPSLDATTNQSPGTTVPQTPKPATSVYPSFVLDPLLK